LLDDGRMLKRPLCLVLAAAIAGAPPAAADATDPFASALPARDTNPPEGIASAAGDSSVDDQQGSASYRHPIAVPPGRNGMAPHLAFDYSSGSPLRGGLAAGWSMALPSIEREPGHGTAVVYRLSLAGSSQLLVPTPNDPGPGTRYRPELDDGFTRVEKTGSSWTVQTPDGRTRTFAGITAASDATTRWNLTSERDSFGNEIVYTWARFYSAESYMDFVLQRIEYTANAAAGLAAHAKLDFVYAPTETCSYGAVPIGAQTDHHFEKKRMRGAQRLTRIDASVRDVAGGAWRLARRHALTYDATALVCGPRPPLRLLTRIDDTAWSPAGVATAAPPVTFGYGPMARDLSSTMYAYGGLEAGMRQGPGSGLMDMNGDGIADWVKVAMPAPGGSRCRLQWHKGTFGGGFAQLAEETELPSAAWSDMNNQPGESDHCTLNGQFVTRPMDTWGTDGCRQRGIQVGYHFLDWDHDGDLDLLTANWRTGGAAACGDFPCFIAQEAGEPGTGGCNQDMGPTGGVEDNQPVCQCPTGQVPKDDNSGCREDCGFGQVWNEQSQACEDDCADFTDCSTDPEPPPELPEIYQPDSCMMSEAEPEQLGSYVWRVYANTGGELSLAPQLIEAPIALPPNGGELSPPQTGQPSLSNLVDVDGDGWLDLIELNHSYIGPATVVIVHRGGQDVGYFPDAGGSDPWSKTTYFNWPQQILEITGPNVLSSTTTVTMLDWDGDGLVDIVADARPTGATDHALYVAFNLDGTFGPLQPLGRPGPVELARIEQPSGWQTPMMLDTGWRANETRMVDLDGDGLVEQMRVVTGSTVSATASQRYVYRFNGDAWNGVTYGYDVIWEAAERLVRAIDRRAWFRASDFVDMTGDGQPDLVTWQANGLALVRTDTANTPPPRLLTTINNGRGGVTTFTYAASTDPTVTTLAPGERVAPRWVVKRIAVAPGHGQPELRTSYRYAHPTHGVSSLRDEGPQHFVGFGEVTTEHSGQAGDASRRTIKQYGFIVGNDRRPHLLGEETQLPAAGGGWTAVSRTERTWQNRPLLGGAVSFTHADLTTERTFGAGGAPDLVRVTAEEWTPYVHAGAVVLYEHAETRLMDAWPAFAWRATVRDFQVRLGQSPYPAGDYRVLETLREEQALVMFFPTVTLAKTVTTYHPTTGLPIETAAYVSATVAARTVRTFDAQTGNLLTEKRPNQVASGSTKVTTHTYDGHRLYVATTVDELAHSTTTKTDVATGAVTRREGPNYRVVPNPAGCYSWPPQPCKLKAYEPHEWTIDGFGRVIEERVAVDPPSGTPGYALAPVMWATYTDGATTKRLVERLRDFGGAARLRDEEFLDGLGRVVRRIVRRQEPGKPDAETTYSYDAGGKLALIRSPDPRTDDGALVDHGYARDGLGRVTQLSRPDGTAEHSRYLGAWTERWTASPIEGDGAVTRLVHDGLGRLVAVHEHDNPAPGETAVTSYSYDRLDRVIGIVDAAGTATTLGHDLGGRRTSIVRTGRTWSYGYDLDGNQLEARAPVPPGELATAYTSVSTFDERGRMTSHTPASRGMSSQRMAELGIGTVQYTYDTGANALGRPSRIAQAPGWSTDLSYDVRGNVLREQRSLTVTGGAQVAATQWVDRSYDATGAMREVAWDDGTRWRYSYDLRGMVAAVDWKPAGGVFQTVAGYDRSTAGAPRERSGAYDQRRTWSYDELGRVTHDRVFRSSTDETLAEKSYGYDGFGRLLDVGGQVGGLDAAGIYAYDARGRVVSAQGPGAYGAALEYTATGNVAYAEVAGTLDAFDRTVDYAYAGIDPQAVTALADRASGDVVGELAYDLQGNLTERSLPTGTSQLAWDGDDRLREVVGPEGTERYWYGAGPERIAAIGPDGVKVWFGESETHFAPNGAVIRRYHHVAAGEALARIENGTTLELQYADGLHNLMLTTSAAGAVTGAFVYGAFGELVGAIGAENHRRQFNGKEADRVSGLRFYGYRHYDPALLRWTSADPLFRFAPDAAWAEPQRANLYAFSLNNPLTMYDPDGRNPEEEKKKKKGKHPGEANSEVTIGEYSDEIYKDGDTRLGYVDYKATTKKHSLKMGAVKASSGTIQIGQGQTLELELTAGEIEISMDHRTMTPEVSYTLVKVAFTSETNLDYATIQVKGDIGVGGDLMTLGRPQPKGDVTVDYQQNVPITSELPLLREVGQPVKPPPANPFKEVNLFEGVNGSSP
jgi:RHS repeat-associated protein